MKKIFLFIAAFSFFTAAVCAQSANAVNGAALNEQYSLLASEQGEELDPRTGFPVIKNKPFVMFDEGFTFAQVTRLELQEGRSNFVWEDNMVGAYFGMQTVNIQPADSMVRIAALYPFSHAFNDVEQVAKQTILYAFDLFAGPVFRGDFWKYVRLNFAVGLHYMYQLSDEYHYNYLGLGMVCGFEYPIAQHWTILTDAMFTLDYPNLGSNSVIQPFDYSWQYHASLGVRYSKKGKNTYSYIDSRPKSK